MNFRSVNVVHNGILNEDQSVKFVKKKSNLLYFMNG